MSHIKPYLRRRQLNAHGALGPQVSYTPDQIAALYQFPKTPKGPDQTIALIELGGGFRKEDIAAYFQTLGMEKLAPHIEAVSVGGGSNTPGINQDADGEVMLDILVAAAAYAYCADAPLNIVCFFGANNDDDFAAAIAAAAAHPLAPSACSISWGGPENRWEATSITKMEAAFKKAAEAQMTVLAAAGDNGSGDGERGKHVDYPASSPQVISCGGTRLVSHSGIIQSETVWNDGGGSGAGGGGFSAFFPKPTFQNALVKGLARGVPDIAGDADPYTGYVVIVDGKRQVIGGTSAVAPLMAALVAAICRRDDKRLGFFNEVLYTKLPAFRDIIIGNNGAFKASSSWDATTGLGVPIGQSLV